MESACDPDGREDSWLRRCANAARLYGSALFAVCLSYYGGLYFLWTIRSPVYWAVLDFTGVPPWTYPFIDMIGPLAWIECHHAGFDVYQANPCDPLDRVFNYSPVFLDMPLSWLDASDSIAASLTMNLAFLITLPFLLRPATARQFAIALLASLSPAVAFALAQANIDVLNIIVVAIVTLYAAGGALGRRLFSYAAYFVVGLIKIYPLVLLGMIARERPRIALGFGGAAGAALIALTVHYWPDLVKALTMVTPMTTFGDMVGAVILPFGLASLLNLPPAVGTILFALLVAALIFVAIRLARLLALDISVSDWGDPKLLMLAAGSFLTVGCFLAGPSIGYRVAILVLVIPGLLALRSRLRDGNMRLLASCAIGMTLFCLWRQFIEHQLTETGVIDVDALSGLIFLLLREAIWWSLIAILSGVVALFIARAPLWGLWRRAA